MASSEPILVFDGHNDTLLDLYLPDEGKERSFFERSEYGHIDLPRAREGGFGGGFFAIFVPEEPVLPKPDKPELPPDVPFEMPLPAPIEIAYAQRTTIAMAASLFRIEAASNGQLKVVRTADELA